MTKAGPQVDLGKVGGLFRKRARPNRYLWISAVGLRSGGLDLMQLRSNLERRNQIGRPGLSGCGRRRRSTAGGSVRGGAALGSPEFADSDPPGVNPTQAWVRAGQCTTRKPHEASDGFGEAYYGERDGGVDLCGGALHQRAGFSGARDYRLSDSTPKEPGRVVGSHRGLLVNGDVA